jgi:hypothetical protein
VEIEAAARLRDDLNISAAVAYLDAKFEDFPWRSVFRTNGCSRLRFARAGAAGTTEPDGCASGSGAGVEDRWVARLLA